MSWGSIDPILTQQIGQIRRILCLTALLLERELFRETKTMRVVFLEQAFIRLLVFNASFGGPFYSKGTDVTSEWRRSMEVYMTYLAACFHQRFSILGVQPDKLTMEWGESIVHLYHQFMLAGKWMKENP
jgi:hypothetical protein